MMFLWTWLKANQGAVSAIASVLTLGIWVLYFQILLGNYRHRLRPKILINRGSGPSFDARCVVTNMSEQPIYVEAIVLALEGDGEPVSCTLSDLDPAGGQGGGSPQRWYQGPLDSGEFIDIGSYRELSDRVEAARGRAADAADGAFRPGSLSVTVIATYTAEDRLIGAERRFDIVTVGDRPMLRAKSVFTSQIRSRRRRRALEQLMRMGPDQADAAEEHSETIAPVRRIA